VTKVERVGFKWEIHMDQLLPTAADKPVLSLDAQTVPNWS
jgi:hypothetical protein